MLLRCCKQAGRPRRGTVHHRITWKGRQKWLTTQLKGESRKHRNCGTQWGAQACRKGLLKCSLEQTQEKGRGVQLQRE
eukprot:1160273-Pelagomonas_calceolata.AAC.3